MENLLEVNNLRVQYETEDRTIYAVNGISFGIKRGETLGLVGETGAGKTTTALSILKLLPERTGSIKEGSIKIDGLEVVNATEADMHAIRGNVVSMIFQDPMTSLNPILTVEKQIEEVLILHLDLPKEQRSNRVDEILQAVGISPSRKKEYPHQFSGGMKQRIVIAMALACNPKLLLADEPTTALDVTIQAQVLQLINSLKKQTDTGILLITHDLGVVAQSCDRVAVMYAGKIVEVGDITDIFEENSPADHHPYTIGLLNSIPKMDSDIKRLSPIAGLMPDPGIKPKGCNFYDRCPDRMECCRELEPKKFCSGTHVIACFKFEGSWQEQKEE